jgi:hypothetical protein
MRESEDILAIVCFQILICCPGGLFYEFNRGAIKNEEYSLIYFAYKDENNGTCM